MYSDATTACCRFCGGRETTAMKYLLHCRQCSDCYHHREFPEFHQNRFKYKGSTRTTNIQIEIQAVTPRLFLTASCWPSKRSFKKHCGSAPSQQKDGHVQDARKGNDRGHVPLGVHLRPRVPVSSQVQVPAMLLPLSHRETLDH